LWSGSQVNSVAVSGKWSCRVPESRPKLVLIADGHQDYLDSMAMLLAEWGYAVVTTRDGLAALETAEAQLPDTVLINMELPGLSGLDVVRAIRKSESLKHMRVVGVSGHAYANHHHVALLAGCDFFFAKPAEPERLRKLLQTL
jgi:CheY-like chemotaxis protein